MNKSTKNILMATAVIAGLSMTNSVLAAPKEVHVHRPLNAWDYYKTNYTEEGAIRVQPKVTTFTTTKAVEQPKTPVFLTIEPTTYGEDVEIGVEMSHGNTMDWYHNIYKIEKVDTFTDNPNLNEAIAFELKDNKIYLKHDSAPIDRNGKQLIKIYATGHEAVEAEIHIQKESPIIEIVAGYEPVTNADILFKLKNFSYATENPIEKVLINGRELKGDCEEYHVVSSLIRLENEGLIKTAGNYTLTVQMNGYKDATLEFRVSQNDGSYIPPEYVHPQQIETSGGTGGSNTNAPVIPTVDTVSSASVATGGGSSSGGSSGGSSSGGGRIIHSNLVFDFDLLANAQILKQLDMETEESKKVLAYWYTSISDAVTIEGETRIVDWNSFATAQATEKTKGNFLTIEEYINDSEAVDYVNRPYQVKYMLNDGLFGDATRYDSDMGIDAPELAGATITKGASHTWSDLDATWLSKVLYVKLGNTYLTSDMIEIGNDSIKLSAQALSVGTHQMEIVAYNYEDVRVPITIKKADFTPTMVPEPKAGEAVVISDIHSDFLEHFRGVSLNGDRLFTEEATGSEGEYKVQGTKVIINGDLIKENQSYSVTLSAYGYDDVVFNFQVKETAQAPDYTLPTVVTTQAVFNDQVEIILADDTAFWRNSVKDIKVGFFTIDASDLELSEHKLVIKNTNLLRRGANDLVIRAEEFVDLAFNITLQEEAPSGLLRHSDVTAGIELENNSEWLDEITTVKWNNVALAEDDYEITYKSIKLKPSVITKGEGTLSIEAEGFTLLERTIKVHDLTEAYPGDLQGAKGLEIQGEVRPYFGVTLLGDIDELWITSLTEFKLNDTVYDMDKLTISENKIVINESIIREESAYKFTFVARGYEDTVIQRGEVITTPEIKNPTPIADEFIYQNQDLALSGSDWMSNITGIKVNGTDVDLSNIKHDVANGRHYIDGYVFSQIGWADIEIVATGYHTLEDRFMVKEALDVPSEVKLKENNTYKQNQDIEIELPYFVSPGYDIAGVELNGALLSAQDFEVSGKVLTIKGSQFAQVGDYEIKVKAKAYKDKVFNVPVAEKAPETLKSAPAAQADVSDNYLGKDIEIQISNIDGYASAIQDIYVGDEKLGMYDYSKYVDKITINDRIFDEAGTYTIRIVADGFEDQSIQQQIKKAPPVLETDLETKVISTTESVITLEFTAKGKDGETELVVATEIDDQPLTAYEAHQFKKDLSIGNHNVKLTTVNDEGTATTKEYQITVEQVALAVADQEIYKTEALSLSYDGDIDRAVAMSVSKVYIDGSQTYSWSPSGNFRIYDSRLDQVGIYQVKLESPDFDDVEFKVTVLPAQVPAEVGLEDDNTLVAGESVSINVISFSSYKSAITDVVVNGSTLDSNDYGVDFYGELTIKGSQFMTAGAYTITIKADGYEDYSVTVNIN